MHLHFWHLISTFQWVFAVSNLCSVHVNIRRCTLCSCRPVLCLYPSVCPDPDLSCLRHNRLQNISTIYNLSTINTISIYISSSVCPFHSIYNSTYRVISSFSTQRYYRNTDMRRVERYINR